MTLAVDSWVCLMFENAWLKIHLLEQSCTHSLLGQEPARACLTCINRANLISFPIQPGIYVNKPGLYTRVKLK